MDEKDRQILAAAGNSLYQDKNDVAKRLLKSLSDGSETEDFVKYMDRFVSQKHISRASIAQGAGLSADYCYKVLRGEKRVFERDYLLAICIAMGLNLNETQRALELYPFPLLDKTDLRSCIIMALLMKKGPKNVDTISDILERNHFERLKTSKDLPGAKIIPHRSTLDNTILVESCTEGGQETSTAMDDVLISDDTVIKAINMGGEYGIKAELTITINGEKIYFYAYTSTIFCEFIVSNKSLLDDSVKIDDPSVIIYESYEEYYQTMRSKYSWCFIELDNRVNKQIEKWKNDGKIFPPFTD